MAKVLFDKQATASFTAIKEALEGKIEKLKRGDYKEPIEQKEVPEAPKPLERNASFQTGDSETKTSTATLEKTPNNPEFREKDWDPEKKAFTEDGEKSD